MKIIIVGVGKLGEYVAHELVNENHEVTLVDTSFKNRNNIINNEDLNYICGNGLDSNTLLEAGIHDADLLISVMDKDEQNVMCCLLGKKLGAKHTIARIRTPEYSSSIDILKEDLGLSMSINPEKLTANHISAIIRSVRPYYEYIIIDSANNFSDETIAVLENTDEIMLVSNPDILSLKAAKNAMNILSQLQIKEKARIIINKATKSLIRSKDFEDMLEMPVYATLSIDDTVVSTSINKGEPFILRSSRAPICKEMNAFVQRIISDKVD